MSIKATYTFTAPAITVEPRQDREALSSYAERLQAAADTAKDLQRLMDNIAEQGWHVSTQRVDGAEPVEIVTMKRTAPDIEALERTKWQFSTYNRRTSGVEDFDEDRLIIEQLDEDESAVFAYRLHQFNDFEYQRENVRELDRLEAAGWASKIVDGDRHDTFYEMTRECASRDDARTQLNELLGDHYEEDNLDVVTSPAGRAPGGTDIHIPNYSGL